MPLTQIEFDRHFKSQSDRQLQYVRWDSVDVPLVTMEDVARAVLSRTPYAYLVQDMTNIVNLTQALIREALKYFWPGGEYDSFYPDAQHKITQMAHAQVIYHLHVNSFSDAGSDRPRYGTPESERQSVWHAFCCCAMVVETIMFEVTSLIAIAGVEVRRIKIPNQLYQFISNFNNTWESADWLNSEVVETTQAECRRMLRIHHAWQPDPVLTPLVVLTDRKRVTVLQIPDMFANPL